ncbi:MAG: hypothetical protein M1839_004893 [Geoglossum umbratile]|nr:MAG: hypothetical protein M1839_004893 [Geoglossum umbratile]
MSRRIYETLGPVQIDFLTKGADLDPRISTLSSFTIHRSTSRIFLPTDADDNTKDVMMDASFSQKRKDLPRLAKGYILGSMGNIAVVIGLDIEYRKTKRATFSIWQPEWGVEDGDFRTEEGVEANTFKSVNPSLSDFLLPSIRATITANPTLSIPFTKLSSWLELAEAYHQITESRTGNGLKHLPPGIVLGKRARSPEETPSPEMERLFVESEDEAGERAMRCDEPYGGGGRQRAGRTR